MTTSLMTTKSAIDINKRLENGKKTPPEGGVERLLGAVGLMRGFQYALN